MIPVQFPGVNLVLAMGQDEYEPLPVRAYPDGRMVMAFRLSPTELEELAATGTLWLQQLTFGAPFQPVALTTQKPEGL